LQLDRVARALDVLDNASAQMLKFTVGSQQEAGSEKDQVVHEHSSRQSRMTSATQHGGQTMSTVVMMELAAVMAKIHQICDEPKEQPDSAKQP